MELDVIATAGNFRARLELDHFPNTPDEDAGMVPVLQVGGDYYGSNPAEPFNLQARDYEEAFNRFGDIARSNSHQREIFARYVTIFHGAVQVQEYNVGISNEYGYIGFDTAAWREQVGVQAEKLATEDYLHDLRAWVDGDAYGVIIEEIDSSTQDVEDDAEWTEVQDATLWGLLGRDYAEQAAKDQLSYYGE